MKIRRILSLILVCAFLLTGCSVSYEPAKNTQSSEQTVSEVLPSAENVSSDVSNDDSDIGDELSIDLTDFSSEDTLRYIDDCIYTDVVNTLDSDAYFVENVETIYYSQEYIDELKFNSLENIYFGYNLSELNDLFKGTKYIFDADRNNNTIVKKAEVFDDTTGKIIKNVAIGTGVILVCVTVSLATGGTAPAVSAIFMASAKAATIGSLSSAGIGAAIATMTTDFSSQSFDDSLKNIVLQASEDFKWGAIIGAVTGGAGKAFELHKATASGLKMSEAATIQNKSKLSVDFIKQIKSMEQYYDLVKNGLKNGLPLKDADYIVKDSKFSLEVIENIFSKKEYDKVYKALNLKEFEIEGTKVLVNPKNIEWNKVYSDGLTNLDRVKKSLNLVDKNGNVFEYHHVGQNLDSPIALIPKKIHNEFYKLLHPKKTSIVDHGGSWNKLRKTISKGLAKIDGVL